MCGVCGVCVCVLCIVLCIVCVVRNVVWGCVCCVGMETRVLVKKACVSTMADFTALYAHIVKFVCVGTIQSTIPIDLVIIQVVVPLF